MMGWSALDPRLDGIPRVRRTAPCSIHAGLDFRVARDADFPATVDRATGRARPRPFHAWPCSIHAWPGFRGFVEPRRTRSTRISAQLWIEQERLRQTVLDPRVDGFPRVRRTGPLSIHAGLDFRVARDADFRATVDRARGRARSRPFHAWPCSFHAWPGFRGFVEPDRAGSTRGPISASRPTRISPQLWIGKQNGPPPR